MLSDFKRQPMVNSHNGSMYGIFTLDMAPLTVGNEGL